MKINVHSQDLLISRNYDSIPCKLLGIDSINYKVLVKKGDSIQNINFLKNEVLEFIKDFQIIAKVNPIRTDSILQKKFTYNFNDKIKELEIAESIAAIENKKKINLFDYRISADYMNTIRLGGTKYIINSYNLSGVNLSFNKSLGYYKNKLFEVNLVYIEKRIEKENDLILEDKYFGNRDTIALGTSYSLNFIACIGISYSWMFFNKKRNNIFYLGTGIDFITYAEYFRIQNYLIYLNTNSIGYHIKMQYDHRIKKNWGIGIGLRYDGGYLYGENNSISNVVNTIFNNENSYNSITRFSALLGLKYYINKKENNTLH